MLAWALAAPAAGCRERKSSPPEPSQEAPGPASQAAAAAEREAGPTRALLLAQAQFAQGDDGPVPGPAKLVILTPAEGAWTAESLEDPESNVFHKAIGWRGGLLTIGAMKASLRHWRESGDTWTPTTLWTRSWGGRFDRLRDLATGDLDGDGDPELVIGTHDQGVIAIGSERDGAWTFRELGQQPDTFIHEIEIGDVDGDGRREVYATPSARNRSDGTSQGGGVVRVRWDGSDYRTDTVADWSSSHAKEILVTDLDGDGRDELYAVREAEVVERETGLEIVDPVRILRYTPAPAGASGDAGASAWTAREIARIDDRQARFLLPGDLDGDGDRDLAITGMNTGVWWLAQGADGGLERRLIDADSGGFEHAAHATDLDGDGKVELYVAADRQRQVRRYVWTGSDFARTVIHTIPPQHITWNIQDAAL